MIYIILGLVCLSIGYCIGYFVGYRKGYLQSVVGYLDRVSEKRMSDRENNTRF